METDEIWKQLTSRSLDWVSLAKVAKRKIKSQLGIDIEVEFVKVADLAQRRTDLSKQYNRKINVERGFFMPSANGFPPIIMVGYEENDDEYISIFYHELQHAIDYFEALPQLGVEVKSLYFKCYTEYKAGFYGTLRYTKAILEKIPTEQEKRQFMMGSKAHHYANVFQAQGREKIGVFDMLIYLSKVLAFAQIEGTIDHRMLSIVPKVEFFMGLTDFINKYELTAEWFTKFKKKIDDFQKDGAGSLQGQAEVGM